MVRKLAMAALFSASAFAFGGAQAALLNCPTSPNDVAGAVTGTTQCQYSNQAPANNGEATVLTFVNTEAYFGNNDWMFEGSLGVGGGASGNWDIGSLVDWDDVDQVMLIFKSADSPLIGYLVADGTVTGTWTSPFFDPPFDFPGSSTQQNVSFIRVFSTAGPGGGEGPGGKVPEPTSLALLGLGLIGLAAVRRRKS